MTGTFVWDLATMTNTGELVINREGAPSELPLR